MSRIGARGRGAGRSASLPACRSTLRLAATPVGDHPLNEPSARGFEQSRSVYYAGVAIRAGSDYSQCPSPGRRMLFCPWQGDDTTRKTTTMEQDPWAREA